MHLEALGVPAGAIFADRAEAVASLGVTWPGLDAPFATAR